MFTTQIIISFIVGGIVIALQTLIAERVPLRWRGIVLTIPTTMALGFFFIGLTKTEADVTEVALFFPAALVGSYAFVSFFALLSRYNIIISFLGSYLIWAVSAYLTLSYPPHDFYTYTLFFTLPITFLLYYLVTKLPQVTNFTPVPMNAKHILVRSLVSGSIVALVVVLAKTLGNMWGSLFSAFPAAFSATFVIYYFAHGKKIIPAVAKALFYPGIAGFLLYALIAGVAFPRFGIWYGTLAAYSGIFVVYCLRVLYPKHRIPNK